MTEQASGTAANLLRGVAAFSREIFGSDHPSSIRRTRYWISQGLSDDIDDKVGSGR